MILNIVKSFKKIKKFIFFLHNGLWKSGKVNISENYEIKPLSSFYSFSKLGSNIFKKIIIRKKIY